MLLDSSKQTILSSGNHRVAVSSVTLYHHAEDAIAALNQYWRFVIPFENNRPAQQFFQHVAHIWRVVWDPSSIPHVYWEDTSNGRHQHFSPSRDRDISTQTYSQGCSFCGSVESQQFPSSSSCCDVSRKDNKKDAAKENKSNIDTTKKRRESKGGKKQYTEHEVNEEDVSERNSGKGKKEAEEKTEITPNIPCCKAKPGSVVPEAKAEVKVVKSIIEGQEKSKTPLGIEIGRASAQRGDEVDIATRQRASKLKSDEVTRIEQNWFELSSDFRSPLQQIQPTNRDMPHEGEVGISGLARWNIWDATRDLTEDLPLHLQQEVYSRFEQLLDMCLLSRPYPTIELRSQSTSSE